MSVDGILDTPFTQRAVPKDTESLFSIALFPQSPFHVIEFPGCDKLFPQFCDAPRPLRVIGQRFVTFASATTVYVILAWSIGVGVFHVIVIVALGPDIAMRPTEHQKGRNLW